MRWTLDGLPPNVWIGTSCEDQKTADERIPHLVKIPAAVRFLSCEPLIGPIELDHALGFDDLRQAGEPGFINGLREGFSDLKANLIHWVICGGESGPETRLGRGLCATSASPRKCRSSSSSGESGLQRANSGT